MAWCLVKHMANFSFTFYNMMLISVLVPVVVLSKARMIFNRSDIGIVSSNPARGMDVGPRFSMLCYPV
jgi:hypothetical protein